MKIKKKFTKPSVERRFTERTHISGKIIIHNNNKLEIGKGVDISKSGIFINTDKNIFKIGEKLKITVKVNGPLSAFNAIAKVNRYNNKDSKKGFGLIFTDIKKTILNQIQEIIEIQNKEFVKKVS